MKIDLSAIPEDYVALTLPGGTEMNFGRCGNDWHAVWASKVTDVSGAFNIRYAKSTGSGSYWGPVSQLTTEEDEPVKPTYYLYRVYAISKESRKVLLPGALVVACDEREAEYAAGVPALLTANGLTAHDVDVICEEVSEVETE